MKKSIWITIALVLLAVGLSAFSAKKRKPHKTKPYKIELPEFVLDYFEPMPMPKDNPLTVEGVELGRYLFYDGILSADRSMSCAACHKQVNAFSDPRRFSIGARGDLGIKQSMSTVNLGWSNFFFLGRQSQIARRAGRRPDYQSY